MLAGREIDVAHETIRCWVNKFGPRIAANLKRRHPRTSPRLHRDEMVCSIKEERWYLWRAVDDEGVVLDLVMQRGRDTGAAQKLLCRLLHNQPEKPELITTDGFASYGAALGDLKLRHVHRRGRLRDNNRAENAHLAIRRRERKLQGFKSRRSAQRFLTAHAAITNNFATERHLNSRRFMRILRARAARNWRLASA